MQIGPDSIKHVSNLFSGINRYRVPLYQRRYVWDVANWETLWRDFIDLHRQIDAGQSDKKHFTGTIITLEKNGDCDIIDGQQRLTTFQVIFCVIRDLCVSGLYPTLASSELLQEVERYIMLNPIEIVQMRTEKDEFAKYRLIPLSHDRKAFLSVVDGELREKIEGLVDTNIVLNQFQSLAQPNQNRIIRVYGYFGVKIIRYLMEKDVDALETLTSTLADKFHLIKIDLNDNVDEPEKVFETINDTGRMLDDFDYLRNHLFLRARKLGSPIDDLYLNYWAKFEKWTARKLEMFFHTFIMAKLGPQCFESEGKSIKPFDCYREYSNALKDPSVVYELEQLSSYADTYEQLNCSTSITYNSDIRKCGIGSRMEFYDNLNLRRLDSFILFLKHSIKLDETDLHIVCDILESYIVRRMLCCDDEDSCAEVNEVFSKAIKGGKFCKREFAATLQDHLPDFSNQFFSVGNAFSRAWSEKDDNLILYILYRIELLRREGEVSYKPLSFGDMKVQERIATPLDCRYPATESIGNIAPLTSDPGADWDSNSINDKQNLLRKLASDLKLSEEIVKADWGSEPERQIENRTLTLVSDFNKIWNPNLADYI